MKRSTVVLFSCLAIAGSAWLAHVVWGQTAETKEEKKVTITKSEFDAFVSAAVAKAVAAERDKVAHDKAAVEEQVFSAQSWHMATYQNAVYVVYTGPGQFMFHHWKEPAGKSSGTSVPPASGATKGGAGTAPAKPR